MNESEMNEKKELMVEKPPQVKENFKAWATVPHFHAVVIQDCREAI